MPIEILPCGDSAVTVEFENKISHKINHGVRDLKDAILEAHIPGVGEMIPTYRALMVQYDPCQISYPELVHRIVHLHGSTGKKAASPAKTIEIPVLYGGKYGPDLADVAQYHHISMEDVVRIHTRPKYLIYMLGFTPGFPYLGGMSKKIATPRLETPRTRIAAGSVGIAAQQTGLYPIDSPGGWRIIGRTPLKLYDPLRENPILLEASQYIKFRAINEQEFLAIQQRENSEGEQ
nr:5-oxoprolinase subunit PxpB [Gehongia tenuis]